MHASCKHANKQWQHIISSPLQRCTDFAKTLADKMGAHLHVETPLQEIDFGAWEGKDIGTVWQQHEQDISQWSQNPTRYTPPGGEPLHAFAERVQASFQRVTQQYKGQSILLVTHGGVIRVLLTYILGMPLAYTNRFHVPYASMSRVQCYHGSSGDAYELSAHNFTLNGSAPGKEHHE